MEASPANKRARTDPAPEEPMGMATPDPPIATQAPIAPPAELAPAPAPDNDRVDSLRVMRPLVAEVLRIVRELAVGQGRKSNGRRSMWPVGRDRQEWILHCGQACQPHLRQELLAFLAWANETYPDGLLPN